MLSRLYDDFCDGIISDNFESFELTLQASPKHLMLAYMAEINLAVNDRVFNRDRVKKGISILEKISKTDEFELGSILYSIGNGWLGLEDYAKAKEVYHSALISLDKPHLTSISAQCAKNMGAALEKLGEYDMSDSFYERALNLDENLNEAHFSIALSHRRKNEFHRMLEHLDKIVFPRNSERVNIILQGWRAEALFSIGDANGAYREVNYIISKADDYEWIWSWCAKQVSDFGRANPEVIQKSIKFWEHYLKEKPESYQAKFEYLMCFWQLRSNGNSTAINYDEFKEKMVEIIDNEALNIGYLWDRIGHWAQYDSNWIEAEYCYRKAFELEEERYGYCLGTALNFLNRFSEAYLILLNQAEKFLPDSMSWFQVGVACSGLGDTEGAISAYKRAIDLDSSYELAWFNLGGVYWNCNEIDEATGLWTEAIRRFPNHDLAIKLRQEFSHLFTEI